MDGKPSALGGVMFTIRGIEFRYDSLINSAVVAVVFIFCTIYSQAKLNSASAETHRLLATTNQLLLADLADRSKSETVIDARLLSIENKQAEHIQQMAEMSKMWVSMQNQLDAETRNRKSGKGTDKNAR